MIPGQNHLQTIRTISSDSLPQQHHQREKDTTDGWIQLGKVCLPKGALRGKDELGFLNAVQTYQGLLQVVNRRGK